MTFDVAKTIDFFKKYFSERVYGLPFGKSLIPGVGSRMECTT
jgi:hypothetical protein